MAAYANERLECLPVVTHSLGVLFKGPVIISVSFIIHYPNQRLLNPDDVIRL